MNQQAQATRTPKLIASAASRTTAPRRKPDRTVQKLPVIPNNREQPITDFHPSSDKSARLNAACLSTLVVNILVLSYYDLLFAISFYELLCNP